MSEQGDVLASGTPVLVTVEDPGWFDRLVRDWEGDWGQQHLIPFWCGPFIPYIGAKPVEDRIAFARLIRDAMHQRDLERAGQAPVVQVALTPAGPPSDKDSGAIHVTRRARHLLEEIPEADDAPTGILPAQPGGHHHAPGAAPEPPFA